MAKLDQQINAADQRQIKTGSKPDQNQIKTKSQMASVYSELIHTNKA